MCDGHGASTTVHDGVRAEALQSLGAERLPDRVNYVADSPPYLAVARQRLHDRPSAGDVCANGAKTSSGITDV